MIDVVSLSKQYKISKRSSGMGAALKQFISPSFETITAINKLNFHIDSGEIVGYMGPNGAGKSTTIKVMSGILTPSEGQCLIDGRIPWKDRKNHVANIGVVFGQRSQLWWDTPVMDSFNLLKSIYRVPDLQFQKSISTLVETLDLKELLSVPVRQLSLGQRMRCELAASLIHEPKILFLDEPTIGLDAVSKLAIRKFIKQINDERKVTVILTTHDTADIEALCKRVMLIGRGEILYDGDFQKLKDEHAPERLLSIKINSKLELDSNHSSQIQNKILTSLSERWFLSGENTLSCSFKPTQIPVKNLIEEVSALYDIVDLQVESIPVDEMVARLYKEHSL